MHTWSQVQSEIIINSVTSQCHKNISCLLNNPMEKAWHKIGIWSHTHKECDPVHTRTHTATQRKNMILHAHTHKLICTEEEYDQAHTHTQNTWWKVSVIVYTDQNGKISSQGEALHQVLQVLRCTSGVLRFLKSRSEPLTGHNIVVPLKAARFLCVTGVHPCQQLVYVHKMDCGCNRFYPQKFSQKKVSKNQCKAKSGTKIKHCLERW